MCVCTESLTLFTKFHAPYMSDSKRCSHQKRLCISSLSNCPYFSSDCQNYACSGCHISPQLLCSLLILLKLCLSRICMKYLLQGAKEQSINQITQIQWNEYNTHKLGKRGTGTAYPSDAPVFTPGLQWGSCYSIFSFMCMFCRSLFVLLYFLFLSLCCLFFSDIQILIALLVSSNSSSCKCFDDVLDKNILSCLLK